MVRSFRLRLAAWSALLAGVALAGFATFAWLTVRSAKLGELVTEARVYAERETLRPSPPPDWAHFEARLEQEILHKRDSHQMVLLSEAGDGTLIYRSAHWPAGLDVAQLTWPAVPPMPQGVLVPRFAAGNGDPLPPPGPPGGGFPGEMMGDAPSPQAPSAGEAERPGQLPQGALRRPMPVTFKLLKLNVGGEKWRFALAASPRSRIAIGLSAHLVDAEMTALRNAFLFALPAALFLIALGAWMISGRALRPLRQIKSSIRAMSAKELDQRIPTGNEDREFSELVSEFNNMLERLEKSFLQASRFSGDAAHELRTPLTILQGQVERAMTEAVPGSPMQALLSGILDETGRLATILRKLLLLSRADAGRMRLQLERVELDDILEALAEDARMLAPRLRITLDATPHLAVSADMSLLHQVLGNLVSNAVKYNVENGWIRIEARKLQGFVVITVSNSSHGIAADARDKVFERFFRTDASHSRNIEGTGLGLSLSREIARAHGGDLSLRVGAKNDVHFKLVLPGKNP